MKSKTSCFEPACFRMNGRRFAPVWILYTVGVLLMLLMTRGRTGYQTMYRVENTFNMMAVVNFLYAVLVALLLFGDLFNTRLCYGLHALPVSRGSIFGSQIVLGLLVSLVPNALCALVLTAILPGWKVVALWWFCRVELQFLYLFGGAVFSVMAAGNLFGMILVDGILQFWPILVLWFQKNLYMPLVSGVVKSADWLTDKLCPVFVMLSQDYVTVEVGKIIDDTVYDPPILGVTSAPWGYALIYAGIGIGLLWLAFRLYRKRSLECAGDLLAFVSAKPLFLLLYTLTVGGAFHLVCYVMEADRSLWMPALFLGLVVGYYTGLMLLKRQMRVFTLKSLAPIGTLCAVILLSLVLTGLDVLGLSRAIPEENEIAAVQFGYYYYENNYKTEDPEVIRQVLDVHRMLVEQQEELENRRGIFDRIFGDESNSPQEWSGESIRVNNTELTYHMKDGSLFRRRFYLRDDGAYIPRMREIQSRPDVVFFRADEQPEAAQLVGPDGDISQLKKYTELAEVVSYRSMMEEIPDEMSDKIYTTHAAGYYISKETEISELLDAILADCKAGHMARSWLLHESSSWYELYLRIYAPGWDNEWVLSISVYPDCENLIAWLEAHDM